MGKTSIASIGEYIDSQPDGAREALRLVRRAIRKALPRAEEVISYKIPAYKLDGRIVIYFAGWKEHYSVYPSTRRVLAAFRRDLAPYELSHKGTIRFPLSEPVPVTLIEGIARVRATEVAERRKAETIAGKKR